jgi:hypothetical protein
MFFRNRLPIRRIPDQSRRTECRRIAKLNQVDFLCMGAACFVRNEQFSYASISGWKKVRMQVRRFRCLIGAPISRELLVAFPVSQKTVSSPSLQLKSDLIKFYCLASFSCIFGAKAKTILVFCSIHTQIYSKRFSKCEEESVLILAKSIIKP